jgi:dTDP-4-dehydrorhamnose reductase
MRVLVTGTQGQLTQSLVEKAAAHQNVEIVAMGRPNLDLELPGSADRAIVETSPDVVINAAAYTAVDAAEDDCERAFRVNADAAGEVAAAAARIDASVIQISTDYVFDGGAGQPYTEVAGTDPINVYGRSKLEGERQVRSANPRHAIVRTSWVYSPFGRNFVRTMMNAAEVRDTLTVVEDQYGSPSSALDLADGLLRMLEAGGSESAEIYHLAGSGSTSWCGFAREVMRVRGERRLRMAQVNGISSDQWPTRAERPRNSVLNSAKFLADFGYQMPEWRSSLAEVIGRLAEQK